MAHGLGESRRATSSPRALALRTMARTEAGDLPASMQMVSVSTPAFQRESTKARRLEPARRASRTARRSRGGRSRRRAALSIAFRDTWRWAIISSMVGPAFQCARSHAACSRVGCQRAAARRAASNPSGRRHPRSRAMLRMTAGPPHIRTCGRARGRASHVQRVRGDPRVLPLKAAGGAGARPQMRSMRKAPSASVRRLPSLSTRKTNPGGGRSSAACLSSAIQQDREIPSILTPSPHRHDAGRQRPPSPTRG